MKWPGLERPTQTCIHGGNVLKTVSTILFISRVDIVG